MLSVAILAKNEGDKLSRCLKSVRFADEIIVIDDESTDKTAQIAKEGGAKVLARKSNGNFASQRNYALQEAKGDWVLLVDADEEITPQLAVEVRRVTEKETDDAFSAYYIRRRDFFWNKELLWGETRSAWQKGIIRLVKKNSGSWEGLVHEVFVPTAKTGVLKSFINHYAHRSIADFLASVNFYSTLRAEELHKKNKKTNILAIFLFPFGKFFYTYFIKLGFRDGAAGFVYSFMMSFHSFLVRSKLYLLNAK